MVSIAPVSGHVRLCLHLVFGLPCRLVNSRSVHSVTVIVHLLSLNRATCPSQSCILLVTSMMSLKPVWCQIQALRFRSSMVMPSMMCSVLRYHCALVFYSDAHNEMLFVGAVNAIVFGLDKDTRSRLTYSQIKVG